MMAKRHSRPLMAAVLRSSFLLFSICLLTAKAHAQIWIEDFNTYADATVNAPPKWTSYATDCDDGGNINLGSGASQWGVWGGAFTCNDIEGAPCCPTFGGGGNDNAWQSESINIAGFCNVGITMDVSAVGTFECSAGGPIFACMNDPAVDNGHDQIVAEYSLNGGGWIQFGYVCGPASGTLTVTGLIGNTLQIRVFVANKANAEYYYFDNVVVNGTTAPTPTFNPVGPLCELDAPVVLPTTSNNGITGTWSPTTINPTGQGGNTITATFTPNVGQCGLPTTMDVTINEPTVPMMSPIGPFCTNDTGLALPPNNSGINGNWSGPGVAGNFFNPAAAGVGNHTLTFTPTPGQCATTNTLLVIVDPTSTPNLGTATVCETDPNLDLTTLQDPMYPTGTWAGPGVTGSSFDPSGQSGNVVLSFQALDPCADLATTSITVNPAITPVISGIPASICENEPPIALPTTQSGVTGNWSGQGVTSNNFNPNGLSGNITLTFTPNVGQCATSATTNINVTPETTPVISGIPASICESDPSINLPTTQSGVTGNWSGQGVSGNTFDPSGLSGNITLTFTPNAGFCAATATTTINVTPETTPVISGIPASICESDPSINLPTTQSGVTGNWSGQGVSGNTFDPSGLGGNITLTFTPNAGFCAATVTTAINVTPETTPVISGIPVSICETESPIALPTTQSGVTGNWSGQGVTNNNFDPTGLSGNITLTFTPDASFCATNATWVINVGMGMSPPISGVPASICETESPIALPTTQSGVTGNWSGQGVTSNNFDPMGLNGVITLTFTPDANFCALVATTDITINQAATPMLGTATLCQTEGLFSLSGLNDPNFPAGNWSGPGVSGNNFDPSGQSGNVTLTFSPSANCVNDATTSVTVNVPVTPTLGTAAICEGDSPLALSTLADPSFPAGTWTGPGVGGGNFDPSGQNGNVTLTFTPSANCTAAATTNVTVNSTPNFTNLMEPCDPTNTNYTVTFELIGGTAPYTVDGIPVTGSTFTSTPIPSGSNYSFVIDDAAGCGPVTASGTENCLCSTDAGTMNLSGGTQTFCYAFTQFSVPFNQDENLDGDDLLQFVLHDNPGATLGNVIATSNSPVFPTPPGLTMGQTYYVSSVAGSNNGSGNIDLNDPCLSVSQGVPIVFYLPTVSLGNDVSICASDCYDIPLQFTGTAPFLFDYTVLFNGTPVASLSADNLATGSTIEFCPSDFNITNGVIEIFVTGMSDADLCNVDFTNPATAPSVAITIGNSVVNNITQTLCPGESIVVNGTQYNEANPTGMELFPSGSFSGCDSVVNVNLAFYPPVSSTLNQTLCEGASLTVNGTVYDMTNPTGTEIFQNITTNGCDSTVFVNLSFNPNIAVSLNQTLCTGGSITVNGTVYDESNPSGTEIIVGGSSAGCDSTVVVNLSFNSVVTEILDPTLCPGESLIVNGTVYDANNPTGTETMPGGSFLGCDSVTVVNLSFFPPAQFDLVQTLCPGGSVTVNGTIYNAANPTGTEVIPGSSINGCDSTVFISLNFAPPANGSVVQTLCPGGALTVGSTVFNQANPSGTVVLPGASFLNCDSTVSVSLSFYQVASSTINDQLCVGESITVNGTVYDQSNPTGTEVFQNATINNCDSTVFINLSFVGPVIVNLDSTVCAGEVVVVNGTLYSESNPTGSETFPGASAFGCDSIVNVLLSFYPEAIGNVTEILQMGDSIVVNGTVYDQQNPTGVEVFTGSSFFGCDSTVFVNLTFEMEDIMATLQVNSPLCRFGEDGTIVLENIVGGTPPYVVALNGGNSAPVVGFPVVFDMLTFGFHTLTIIDAVGNIATQEVFMPDAPELTLNLDDQLSVPLGNSITLSASASAPIVTWTWSPPDYLDCTDCPNPVSTPLDDIVYTLAVTDVNGCTAFDEVTVLVEKVQEVYVPNAFSPNNDGINDELTVFAGPQVELVKGFQVYSRWGELIFEQYNFPPNDLQIGWDGKFKEKQLDPAVFVWVAEVLFLDGQTRLYKGDVTLTR